MATITSRASAFTNTTGFNVNFINPQNAYATDTLYSTMTTARNQEGATNFRGFNFSSIPVRSIINSVNVFIVGKVDSSWTQGQWRSSIWEDVTIAAALTVGTTGAIGPNIQYVTPSTNVIENTWNFPSTGTLPTLLQLKAINFGIRIQGSQGNNGTAHIWSVNDIYITVDYTPVIYFGIFKRWNGSAWVKAKMQNWNGTIWDLKKMKRWNGSAWVEVDITGV
jgi:hypothetical protein